MEIRGVGQTHGPLEYQRQTEGQTPQVQGEQTQQDIVQISDEARKLLGREQSAQPDLAARDDFTAKLADRLLTSGYAKNPDEAVRLSEKISGKILENGEGGQSKDLREVAEKVRSGFYTRPDVIDKVADRMLGELGL